MDLVRDDLEPTGPPIRFNKDEDQDSLMELAERMLTAFYDSEQAKPQGELLCIEEAVSGSMWMMICRTSRDSWISPHSRRKA
jgi:hypothetical protein